MLLVLGPIVLSALFLAVIWHLTLTRIEGEERLAIQNTVEDNGDIASVVRGSLDQVIGKTAIYADLASALLGGERQMAAHLNPSVNGDRAYLRLAVFDDKSQLRHSSARQQSEPVLAAIAKEVSRDFRAIPPPNAVVVGRPRTDQDAWRVPLLLGIWRGNQSQGVLAAVLDLGYFLRLFQDVQLGSGGRIEIIGDDGYQLVESNGTTVSAGRDFRESGYLGFLRAANKGSGLVMREGDRSKSIVAYYRLESYPLTVIVSRDYDDVMAEYKSRREDYILWAAAISLLLIPGAIFLVWLARRQHFVHRAQIQSDGENRRLIGQLEQEKQRAYQLASHDHLTGLPNRGLFSEMANSHILQARRSRRYNAVLFVDLDRFKAINDTLGHRVGDLLLQEVANRFRSCLRESDLVARLGGDEFVILLNEVDAVDGVATMAEKLVGIISEPFIGLDGHDVEISPSIGIAIYPRDGEGIEVLLKHADAAMYLSKAAGRGTYRFYDEALNRRTLQQLELLQALRRAVREGEFVIHYQPRVATGDFSVTGLEALVRWQHPDLGLIFPNDFIPLAEENELIVPLGLWVIDAVCAQAADWRRRQVATLPVAINISAKQLCDDSLVTHVQDALQRHDIPSSLLEVEITESCLVEAPERVAAVLAQLADLGVKVSLDDYGTGFASLGYLKILPLYAIKIDRSFIREILNDSSDAIIVASTTTLAHNLNLVVIAEGVESRAQLLHVKTVGCDQVQGYYFQRPVAANEIEPILRRGKFTV